MNASTTSSARARTSSPSAQAMTAHASSAGVEKPARSDRARRTARLFRSRGENVRAAARISGVSAAPSSSSRTDVASAEKCGA